MSNYALGKALRVLSQFGALHPERSVTELSRVTGLSKSNVSKILREFRTHGFLEQDQHSRRYRVGPQALTVGAGYFAGSGFVRRADRFMRGLVERTDATATLNVVCDTRILFVAARDAGKPPFFSWPVGSYIPLHATAAGKIAAAFAPTPNGKSPIAKSELRSFTPATICEVATLMQQLAEIRRCGIACTFGESTYGLAGVAAPIVNDEDAVVGAISVLVPLQRARDTGCDAIIAAVRETARDVSRDIGATHYPFGRLQ